MIKTGIASFALGSLLFAGFSGVNAASNSASSKTEGDANRTAIETAINNGDYTAWLTAIGNNSKLTSKITADNFSEYAAAEKLIQEGMTKLKALGVESGCSGCDRGGKKMTDVQRTAADTAIANSDYNAWKTAMGDCPMTENITADNFAKYAEAEKLMKSGDTTGAQKIFDELGIKRGGPKGGFEKGDRGTKNNSSSTDTSTATSN